MAFSFFKSKKEEKVEDDTQEKVQELPIEQVEVNEDHPRQVFSEESIAELAETIQSACYNQLLLGQLVTISIRLLRGKDVIARLKS